MIIKNSLICFRKCLKVNYRYMIIVKLRENTISKQSLKGTRFKYKFLEEAEEITREVRDEVKKLLPSKNIVVKKTVRARRREFEDKLNFGIFGITNNPLAIWISARETETVRTVLIPPCLDGALYTDRTGNTVGVDYFYIFRDGEITPVILSNPVELQLADFRDGSTGSTNLRDRLLVNPQWLTDRCDNKADCSDIFNESGFKVPKKAFLEDDDVKNKKILTEFLGDEEVHDFVIKGNSGSQGSRVGIFRREDIDRAIDFAKRISRETKVFVEERIIPLSFDDRLVKQDWNIRAIVTFEEKPVWVDSEVRHQEWGHSPVNISIRAAAKETVEVCKRIGFDFDQVVEVSLKAASALHKKISDGQKIAGVIGFDLIVSEEGIYIIEVNGGNVGGFSTIVKMRSKALDSVPKMIGSFERVMLDNRDTAHRKARDELEVVDNEDSVLRWISARNKKASKMNIALEAQRRLIERKGKYEFYDRKTKIDILIEAKRFDDALEEIKKLNEDDEYNKSQKLGCLAWVLGEKKEFEKAVEVIREIEKIWCDAKDKINEHDLEKYLGILYYKAEKYEEAFQKLGRYLEVDPEDDITRQKHARCASKIGRHDVEREQLKKLIEKEDTVDRSIRLAECELELMNYQETRRIVREVLKKIDRKKPGERREYIICLQLDAISSVFIRDDDGGVERAKEIFKTLGHSERDILAIIADILMRYSTTPDYSEVFDYINGYIKHSGKTKATKSGVASANSMAGKCLINLGEKKGARKYLEEAIRIKPDHKEALELLREYM